MKKTIMYRAKDDKLFETKEDCEKYEKHELKQTKWKNFFEETGYNSVFDRLRVEDPWKYYHYINEPYRRMEQYKEDIVRKHIYIIIEELQKEFEFEFDKNNTLRIIEWEIINIIKNSYNIFEYVRKRTGC